MPVSASLDITKLLLAWGRGEPDAQQKLYPVVYGELHRLAHGYMQRERPGHTLQTTALVNEAYLRLVDSKQVRWENRAQFFALSAQLMRHILVDFARSRGALKRGGQGERLSVEESLAVTSEKDVDLLALDDALNNLATVDPRKSRVVELRFFGGLSVEEAAEVLEVSAKTVMRDWKLAKAWLRCELSGQKLDES